MAALVLAVLLAEAIFLSACGRRLGLPAADAFGAIVPGAALALALLLAIAGCGTAAVGGALLVAGMGHVYDLRRRRRRPPHR